MHIESPRVCACPLTPLRNGEVDIDALSRQLAHLAATDIDAIVVLTDTGVPTDLSPAQRRTVTELAAERRGDKPLIVGITALTPHEAIEFAKQAQACDASALFLSLAPLTQLTASETVAFVREAAANTSLPLILDCATSPLDNGQYRELAALTPVTALILPTAECSQAEIDQLRIQFPAHIKLGISEDAAGPAGLSAGFDAWFSPLAGTLPELALTLAMDPGLTHHLDPLWELIAEHGSLRVIATIAEELGLATLPCLPPPLTSLTGAAREQLARILPNLAFPDENSGDGWVKGPDGNRYWGKFGASGLLVFDPNRGVLLQHRAIWSHEGGTWGIPGGARDLDETPYEGALREAFEEANVPARLLTPIHEHTLDLGFWSYRTFVAVTRESFEATPNDTESEALEWIALDEVANLPLHPGFADAWPQLREIIDEFLRTN